MLPVCDDHQGTGMLADRNMRILTGSKLSPQEATTLLDIRKISLLYVLASLILVVLVVACLYWARVVLIPVALAVLLTFLLNPIVDRLQRRGLGRTPAVALIVVVAFLLLGGIGWVTVLQLTTLANELPQHRHNIKQKIADLRAVGKGGIIEKIQETVQKVTEDLEKAEELPKGLQPGAEPERPVPVVVQAPSVLWQLPSLLEPLATAGLVFVLVLFMLIQYSDLRNRLIRLTSAPWRRRSSPAP
jgi:predicted PurR-regulated permease PerM